MMSAQLQRQRWLRAGSVFIFLLAMVSGSAQAQSTVGDSNDIRTLVLQLQSELRQTRQDLAQAQRQIQRLSAEVAVLNPSKPAATPEPPQSPQSTYISPADVPEPDLAPQSSESAEGQDEDVSLLRAK